MSSTRQRILFIEINDDGTVGGSHRALFDLVRFLDSARYEPVVLFYQHNPYIESFRSVGVRAEVWPRPPTRRRRAYQPLHMFRSVREATALVTRCRRFLRSESIDLVHMNNAICDGWNAARQIFTNTISSSSPPTAWSSHAVSFVFSSIGLSNLG